MSTPAIPLGANVYHAVFHGSLNVIAGGLLSIQVVHYLFWELLYKGNLTEMDYFAYVHSNLAVQQPDNHMKNL